jgi:hypothetical protein
MTMMIDLLKQVIGMGDNWPQRNDKLMERPPMEGEKSGRTVHPDTVQMGQNIAKDPKNIYSDKGSIEGYDGIGGSSMTDFIKKISEGMPKFRGEQGTLMGFLSRIMNPAGMATDKGVMQKQGTVGGGVGSDHVPGTGVDPGLSTTPMAKQRQRNMAPVDPNNSDLDRQAPPDYSQPTALDPNQIEELRKSLLTQAGQMDPNNPNGLAGRMTGPYSKVDQNQQMGEAEDIASGVRGGYNSVTSRSPLEEPAKPAAPVNFQDALKNMLFGG